MKQKLNIGIFLDTYFPMIDGVINVVDNYAKRLNEIANVTVFAPYGRDKKHVDNYPYKLVRTKRMRVFFLDYDLPLPQFDKNFKKILKDSNFDLIHIHSPFTLGSAAVKYARKNKIPVVATMHSQYKKDFYRATKSKLITNILVRKIMKVFNACDECWAVNSKIAEVFSEYGATTFPKVMNNGTHLNYQKDTKPLAELINKAYNIAPDEKVYLFVGRITTLKNIFFIVDALKIAKEKGHRFKMLFVGSGMDKDKLETYIKDKGMENEIILCGRVSDEIIVAAYSRAHLFLFPSLYDASSLVQIEAASQKTPSIFLAGAATSDTVTKDVNGFVVENNAEAFADKIIEVSADEAYYKKVSEGAYRDLYRTWDSVVEESYARYLNIIKNKKR